MGLRGGVLLHLRLPGDLGDLPDPTPRRLLDLERERDLDQER